MLQQREVQLFDSPGEGGSRSGRIAVTVYQDIAAR
jgi:hypothetical protein